jgi:hypothetical protein
MDIIALFASSRHGSITQLEVGKIFHADKIILDDVTTVRDPRCYLFLRDTRGTERIWTAIPPEPVSDEILTK